jgi:hypothetical protein
LSKILFFAKQKKRGGRIIDKNILFEPLYSRKLNEKHYTSSLPTWQRPIGAT